MKKGVVAVALAICIFLSGCGTFVNGEYIYTQPHETDAPPQENSSLSAKNYRQLYSVLEKMVQDGASNGVILVPDYDQSEVASDAIAAADELRKTNPIAAYAVSDIRAVLGTTGGEPALAITISYTHDRAEIRQIKEVNDVTEATALIHSALNACNVGIVLKINQYQAVDFTQIVEDYATAFPEYVIEQPRVTVNVYPDNGEVRVVELNFTYRTNRESLKEMQNRVRTMFTSARLYVSVDTTAQDKFTHLYTFIMERFEFDIATSITPAYSLLLHGVGDQRAFAIVYAAMCTREGLECYFVSGTRNGVAHYWNIVGIDGKYYHVDLLRSRDGGVFRLYTYEQMSGYVWDYDAYPACVGQAKTAQ